MPLTRKQLRAIFAKLGELGIPTAGSGAKSSQGGIHKILPQGALSKHHSKSFEELLRSGESVSSALEKIRLGGIYPRVSGMREDIAAQLHALRNLRPTLLAPKPYYPVEGAYTDKILIYPPLKNMLEKRPQDATQRFMAMYSEWFDSPTSLGARKLRATLNQALGGIFPQSKMLRAQRYRRKYSVGGGTSREFKELVSDVDLGLAAVARDVFVGNQAVLQKDFPKGSVELYRGITSTQANRIVQSLDNHKMAVLNTNMLSSWTENFNTAEDFVDMGGVVVRLKMPIERSFSSWRSLPYSIFTRQQEHLVIGDRFWITRNEVIIPR